MLRPPQHRIARPARSRGRRAFSLVELVVVVIVLATLAGFITPALIDAIGFSEEQVTLKSMGSMREAIIGTERLAAPNGYFADAGALPRTVRDLYERPDQPGIHFVPPYNVKTGFGWRGPYLANVTGIYVPDAADGFTTLYGTDPETSGLHPDPAMLDAWGKPIVVQFPDANGDGIAVPDDQLFARLVSAGANGILETPLTDLVDFLPIKAHYPPKNQCGDDLVLYLRVPDMRPPLSEPTP